MIKKLILTLLTILLLSIAYADNIQQPINNTYITSIVNSSENSDKFETNSTIFWIFIIVFIICLIGLIISLYKKSNEEKFRSKCKDIISKLFLAETLLKFVEIFTFIGIIAFVGLYASTFYNANIVSREVLSPIIAGFGFTFTVIFLYRGALNNKKTLELSDKKQLRENFNGAVKNLESGSSGVRMGGVHSLMDFVTKFNSKNADEKAKYEEYGKLAYDILVQHARETSHKLGILNKSNNNKNENKEKIKVFEVELQETLDSMFSCYQKEHQSNDFKHYNDSEEYPKDKIINEFNKLDHKRHNRPDELYPNWKSLYVKEINLNCMNLSNMYFGYANFTDAKLDNANFTNSNLKEATLVGASLVGSNLTNVNLQYSNLYKAKNFTLEQLKSCKNINYITLSYKDNLLTELSDIDMSKLEYLMIIQEIKDFEQGNENDAIESIAQEVININSTAQGKSINRETINVIILRKNENKYESLYKVGEIAFSGDDIKVTDNGKVQILDIVKIYEIWDYMIKENKNK